jgi:hypothetical protein
MVLFVIVRIVGVVSRIKETRHSVGAPIVRIQSLVIPHLRGLDSLHIIPLGPPVPYYPVVRHDFRRS